MGRAALSRSIAGCSGGAASGHAPAARGRRRLAPDLVALADGKRQRLHDGRPIGRYRTGAQIENEGLPTAEALLWIDDPIEAFFLHVQGSGRVRLPDGSVVRIGFADHNGHRYHALDPDTFWWAHATFQHAVEQVAEAQGVKLGKVAQPLRVALTGQAASPGIGITLELVGRERALQRIARAIRHARESG